MNLQPTSTRFLRNQEIVDQQAINWHEVVIIGVGAIGSQVAEQLAKLGVRRFTLIDHDVVSEHNLSVQGFYDSDVGLAKVHAVADRLRAIRGDVEVEARPDLWTLSDTSIPSGSVVFATVDSIGTRRELFEHELLKRRAPCLFDARMTAETFQLFCIPRDNPEAIAQYRKSLFPSSQAHRETCTARSTIYCSAMAAASLTAMFKAWAMREATGYHHTRFDFNIRMFDTITADLKIG